MAIAKTLNGSTVTISDYTAAAYDAIAAIQYQLDSQSTTKQAQIYDFEDSINPLAGAIQNESATVINDIQLQCSEVIAKVTTLGLSITLSPYLTLPIGNTAITTGKLLTGYTVTSAPTPVEVPQTDAINVFTLESVQSDILVNNPDLVISDPYPLNPALLPIVDSMASGNLQENLTQISVNPIAELLESTSVLLHSLVDTNFSGIDSQFPTIASDIDLQVEYAALKDALGGGDGLSGAVAQLDSFRDHTDRLSGLVLSSDSELAEQTDDTLTENLFYRNIPISTTTQITQYNAKKFRSSKYYIQASSGNEHQMTEFMVIHDNKISYIRSINSIYTIDPFVTYTATFLNGKVIVYATSLRANTDLVIHGIRLQIAKDSSSSELIDKQKILENSQILAHFYRDDVDYIAMQSKSLVETQPVQLLKQELSDMATKLTISTFTNSSSVDKQNVLTSITNAINNTVLNMQTLIDNDYEQYQIALKKVEALKILTNMANSNTNSIVLQTTEPTIREYL